MGLYASKIFLLIADKVSAFVIRSMACAVFIYGGVCPPEDPRRPFTPSLGIYLADCIRFPIMGEK